MSAIDPWLLQFDWRPISRIQVVVNDVGNDFYWSLCLIFPDNIHCIYVVPNSECGRSSGTPMTPLERWNFLAAPGLRVHHVAQVVRNREWRPHELFDRRFGSWFWV